MISLEEVNFKQRTENELGGVHRQTFGPWQSLTRRLESVAYKLRPGTGADGGFC